MLISGFKKQTIWGQLNAKIRVLTAKTSKKMIKAGLYKINANLDEFQL